MKPSVLYQELNICLSRINTKVSKLFHEEQLALHSTKCDASCWANVEVSH